MGKLTWRPVLGNTGVTAGPGTMVIVNAGPNTTDGWWGPPPPRPPPGLGRPPTGGAGLGDNAGPTTVSRPILLSVDTPRTGWASISHRSAHDFLEALRVRSSGPGFMDLTDNTAFDWRTYLLYREDYKKIIGTGVVGFGFQRFNWIDPRTEELRTDFVVLRQDGSAVRLHPPWEEGLRGKKRRRAPRRVAP